MVGVTGVLVLREDRCIEQPSRERNVGGIHSLAHMSIHQILGNVVPGIIPGISVPEWRAQRYQETQPEGFRASLGSRGTETVQGHTQDGRWKVWGEIMNVM